MYKLVIDQVLFIDYYNRSCFIRFMDNYYYSINMIF